MGVTYVLDHLEFMNIAMIFFSLCFSFTHIERETIRLVCHYYCCKHCCHCCCCSKQQIGSRPLEQTWSLGDVGTEWQMICRACFERNMKVEIGEINRYLWPIEMGETVIWEVKTDFRALNNNVLCISLCLPCSPCNRVTLDVACIFFSPLIFVCVLFRFAFFSGTNTYWRVKKAILQLGEL